MEGKEARKLTLQLRHLDLHLPGRHEDKSNICKDKNYLQSFFFDFLVHLSNKRTLDHCPIHVFWLLPGHKNDYVQYTFRKTPVF